MMEKKSSFTYDELIQIAEGKTYGLENGKLPLPPMLMCDRITKISSDGGENNLGYIEAELDINPELWFFQCHFANDPVMPGCLGLDALWQLLGFHLVWNGHKGKGRALGVGEVKFTGQVLPKAKKIIYKINIKRVISRGLILVIGDGVVECDGIDIYKAENLKVGLFQD
ncbi:MAG: bifunctional 3-hydroxydecanoyl-ACP dehydratase/trans-2-decenoyl-ACP isomerase [Candidatus Kapabacteria bacterium]|nr:bifunctional 3-hydroxydecanoyl-ACP dehydratase/trans-2-decenoyl-ACP isomerase [Candidatus Kapabacteria bacterium]